MYNLAKAADAKYITFWRQKHRQDTTLNNFGHVGIVHLTSDFNTVSGRGGFQARPNRSAGCALLYRVPALCQPPRGIGHRDTKQSHKA